MFKVDESADTSRI